MAIDHTFQTSVRLYPAIGIPGGYAAVNPIVSTPVGYLVKTAVTCGAFCWEDTTDAGQVVPSGSGMPLGLVVRNITSVNGAGVVANNTMVAGTNANVAVEGDFFVQPAAEVTKGQKVFANLTTGAVSGAAAGATVSGSIETNWAFATSAEAGEIAIITNHGQTPAASAVAGSFVSSVVAGDTNYTLKVTKGGTDSTVNIGHA